MNAEESFSYVFRSGRHETTRDLIINKFNVSDNGQYICELRRYYVKWRAQAEKHVGIGGTCLAHL